MSPFEAMNRTAPPQEPKAAQTAAANPLPEAILQAREAAGLSQSEAGALIYSGLRSWQHWEWGTRRMHPGLFELFLKKTGQMS